MNNDEVLFIKVNWPSSHTYSQTPWCIQYTIKMNCWPRQYDIILRNFFDRSYYSCNGSVSLHYMSVVAHARMFIYWLDMYAYCACQKVKMVCRYLYYSHQTLLLTKRKKKKSHMQYLWTIINLIQSIIDFFKQQQSLTLQHPYRDDYVSMSVLLCTVELLYLSN